MLLKKKSFLAKALFTSTVGLFLISCSEDKKETNTFELKNIEYKVGSEESQYTITLPSVMVVGSSLTQEEFSNWTSDVQANKEKIKKISAQSITIPEFLVSYSGKMSIPGQKNGLLDLNLKGIYKNIVISDIKDGVVSTGSIDPSDMDYSVNSEDLNYNVTYGLGKFLISHMDLNVIYSSYTSTRADDQEELKLAYKEMKSSGITVKGHVIEGNNTRVNLDGVFEDILYKNVMMRPFKAFPMSDLTKPGFFISIKQNPKTLFGLYANIFSSFDLQGEASGFSLKMTPEASENKEDSSFSELEYKVGKILLGNGGFAYKNFDININGTASGDIAVSFDNLSFDKFSFQTTAQALFGLYGQEDLGSALKRPGAIGKLIPQLGQINFDKLNVFKKQDGNETKLFSLDSVSFNSLEQTHGIPSSAQFKISDLSYDLSSLPQNVQNDLKAFGLSKVHLNYGFDYAWNKSTKDFVLNSFGGSLAEVGNVDLSTTIKNFPEAAFTLSQQSAFALLAATVKDLKLSVKDEGGVNKLIAYSALEQEIEPGAFKDQLVSQIKLMASMFGSENETIQTIAQEIESFLVNPKTLELSIQSKDENGLGAQDFMEASSDPVKLLNKVNVSIRNN